MDGFLKQSIWLLSFELCRRETLAPEASGVGGATYHRVSRHLLAARINAGLIQRQVAKRMGTTTSAVSRLENAAGHPPTLLTLEHYAAAVECSLEIRLIPLP